MWTPRWLLIFFFIVLSLFQESSQYENQEQQVKGFFEKAESASGHTNNWAVLVCASRYWFNYRHMSNALGMYRTVKRLGIPDSNIILMLADDAACNARNRFPGAVYSNPGRKLDLYGENIEVDYRGYDVTVENLIRVLTGRVPASYPRSKRLLTDDRSNVFVYMTGHGGNEFLKFQDNEEMSAFDLADAFEQMWQKKRSYKELFFMVDTCQANTLYSKLYSPNILATGSSQIGENSYSHDLDYDIGVSVIDTYTHYMLQFLEGINKTSKTTMEDLFNIYDPVTIRSHPGVRTDLFSRPLNDVLVTDFFGGVADVDITEEYDTSWDLYKSDGPVTKEPRPNPSKLMHVEKASYAVSIAKEAGERPTMSRAWAALALTGLLVLFTLLHGCSRTTSSTQEKL
ncbi:peptidase C13 family-domain-containing protein [Hysterangium stoloniferum]|nr:peptidase C13 family-domain-containing protein [Hysterangium stoloniferum]